MFFNPTDQPAPLVTTSVARRLRDALEPIATHGWWSRQPMERLASLGLGFFDAYVWGRAAALGTPTPSVLAATFRVFDPTFIGAVYERAACAASRHAVLEARAAGAAESLASLVSASDASAIADPLLDALDGLDGMGRPLFSALRELPLPTTPQGRLWRAAPGAASIVCTSIGRWHLSPSSSTIPTSRGAPLQRNLMGGVSRCKAGFEPLAGEHCKNLEL